MAVAVNVKLKEIFAIYQLKECALTTKFHAVDVQTSQQRLVCTCQEVVQKDVF